MNALHLLWIVPTAAVVGFIWGAILAAGKLPPEDNVQPQGEDYCATCPFNPNDKNKEE